MMSIITLFMQRRLTHFPTISCWRGTYRRSLSSSPSFQEETDHHKNAEDDQTSATFSVEIKRIDRQGYGEAEICKRQFYMSPSIPEEPLKLKVLAALPKEKALIKVERGITNKRFKSWGFVVPEKIEDENWEMREKLVRCPHYKNCGGCNLMHLNLKSQVEFKRQGLENFLQRSLGDHLKDTEFLPIITAPVDPLDNESYAWNYRSKARINAKWHEKTQKFFFGFICRKSNNIVEMESCSVLRKSFNSSFSDLKRALGSLSIYNQVPCVELGVGDDDDCAIIVRNLAPLSAEDTKILLEYSEKHRVMIYLQPGSANSTYLLHNVPSRKILSQLPSQFHHLSEFLHYSFEDIKFFFIPTDFTQTNLFANQKMVSTSIEFLDLEPSDCVLDLFCGIGNFSLPIAKRVSQVVGVEGSEEAVKRANQNLKFNSSITNATFFFEDLYKITPKRNLSWMKTPFNKLLIDPPRSGCEITLKVLLPNLSKVTKIVYVSCNIETFAKDAKMLAEHGFVLKKVAGLEMFPHTKHLEVISVFERRPIII